MRRPTSSRYRAVRRAGLAVVVLLLLGGMISYLALNRWLRLSVEQHTARSLNLRTTVESATLGVFSSRLHLEQFRLASPDGFSGQPLLVVGQADLHISYPNLRHNPVRIRSVTFTRPQLLVENVDGVLNIKRMVDRLPSPAEHPLKLIIDEVTVTDATVILRPGLADLPAEITVRVPTFTLRNVGTGEGSADGATIRQVVTQLVTALAANASDSPALPPALRDLLKDPLRAILSELGAEARRQILRAAPGPMGKALAGWLGPGALKDPGRLFGGLTGRGTFPSTPVASATLPATGPATRPKGNADADGPRELLRGLFGGVRKSNGNGAPGD